MCTSLAECIVKKLLEIIDHYAAEMHVAMQMNPKTKAQYKIHLHKLKILAHEIIHSLQ